LLHKKTENCFKKKKKLYGRVFGHHISI